MKIWHNKHQPEPFYGPDDYSGWGSVEEEQEAHNQFVERWIWVHKNMTFKERVVHFFSRNGCFVEMKD